MGRAAGLLALLLLLIAVAPARAQMSDHYALVMVWMPGLCAEEHDREECKDLTLRRYDGRNLAFFALQVARDSGLAQTFCFTMPSAEEMDRGRRWCDMDKIPMTDTIAAALTDLMPVMRSCQDRGLYAKYGSCTLYSADDYYSRGIKLAQAVATTRVNAKIAGAVGTTAKQSDLVAAFEEEFGDGSGTAIDFVCRRIQGRAHLVQVKISLTARGLTRGLGPDFLWKPRNPLRRSCPEAIIIDAPPVPITAGAGDGSPAPDAPPPPAKPTEAPVPEAVPVPPVETAPLGPKKN
jgi:ribonuclease T2